MPTLKKLSIIDLPLIINPIPIIELKSPQREFSQGSNSGWHTLRQAHHQRGQDHLEPLIPHLERIEHTGIERLLAAVEPGRHVPEVGPFVGEMAMVLAAQEMIDRSVEVPHRRIAAPVLKSSTEVPDERTPESVGRIAHGMRGKPPVPRPATFRIEPLGLRWGLDSGHLPRASVETV